MNGLSLQQDDDCLYPNLIQTKDESVLKYNRNSKKEG